MRKRKDMRGELTALLRSDALPEEGGTLQSQIACALVKKALGGDLKTLEFILSLTGEEEKGSGGIKIELGKELEELAL